MKQKLMKQKQTKKETETEKRKRKKEHYEDLKRQMETQIDNDTLQKYRILSEAWKIGKELHGPKFTLNSLATDFELAWSTVKRIMSLRRANVGTWKLIDDKKISAYKVAMICSSKNIHYQDEIVEEVIKDNLSARSIKNMRVRQLGDIKLWRVKRALDEGFKNKDNTYHSWVSVIRRLKLFLLMDVDSVRPSKRKDLLERLGDVNEMIEIYLKKNKLKWNKNDP